MQKIFILCFGVCLLMLGQGCLFNRTVVNAQVRDLDTSFIRPGQTKAQEIITRLGPPPPLPELTDDTKLYTDDFLRYTCYETRRTAFIIGYVVIFPFWWSDTQAIDETLITFDDKGVVREVIKTQRKTVRPPFMTESSRPPLICKRITNVKGAK